MCNLEGIDDFFQAGEVSPSLVKEALFPFRALAGQNFHQTPGDVALHQMRTV